MKHADMNPVNVKDPQAIKDWNEQMIDKYKLVDYYDHHIPLIRWIERKRLNMILSELIASDDAESLEIGCGAGQVLERVPRGKLSGFDLSERLVELTRKKILNQFPERLGVLVPGDAQAWPEAIRERSYTNIFCSEVIEHIPEPRKLMENLWGVADEHTRAIVISTPNEPLINRLKKFFISIGLFKKLFPNISNDMTEEWHLSSFDIPLMKKMCDGLFLIKKIQGVPFRWLPVRYVFSLEKIKSDDHDTRS
ncbi:MAG: class I SAM-dependent methyltransferase [Candidatus Shapirobacteria bacterium]|jgi:2-polyprenyl-3-methyl-5-hydroxy-6-metoxy-1,4-benzoquinol methylase